MNLNPFSWLSGRKAADPLSNQGGNIAQSTRQTQALGPFAETFAGWSPRNSNPYLYEALREAIPILDGGVARLGTMDGIISVEGESDKLVAEIEEWMRNVPVNDVEAGFQAFYASQGNELYEQGLSVGEFMLDPKARDVVGLRVADSKGIAFVRDAGRMRVFYRAPGISTPTRTDGLESVEALLRRGVRPSNLANLLSWGYVELDPARLVMGVNQPEADNPYGTSIMRSVPFVAQILLKIQNATGRSWERFGDPLFHVQYKTKNRKLTVAEVQARAAAVVASLGTALGAKARGNSVDISTGAAADDDVTIEVVGAQGDVLSIEAPARHMIEQVVAAFGLPPWMLGITWSQAAGIGEQQSVVVLQEAQTRFARRRPFLERPVATMLRARGRSWKPKDWQLVQHLPNLMDEAKKAQAAFLRAQTAMMLDQAGQALPPDPGTGIDNGLRAALEALLKEFAQVER